MRNSNKPDLKPHCTANNTKVGIITKYVNKEVLFALGLGVACGVGYEKATEPKQVHGHGLTSQKYNAIEGWSSDDIKEENEAKNTSGIIENSMQIEVNEGEYVNPNTPTELRGTCNANKTPITAEELYEKLVRDLENYGITDKEIAKTFIPQIKKAPNYLENIQEYGKEICSILPNGKGLDEKEKFAIFTMVANVMKLYVQNLYPELEIPKNATLEETKAILLEQIGQYPPFPINEEGETLKELFEHGITDVSDIGEIREISKEVGEILNSKISDRYIRSFIEETVSYDDPSKHRNAEHDAGLFLIKEIIQKYGKIWDAARVHQTIENIANSVIINDDVGPYEDWEKNLTIILTGNFGMKQEAVEKLKQTIIQGKKPQTLEEKIAFILIQKGKMRQSVEKILNINNKEGCDIEI